MRPRRFRLRALLLVIAGCGLGLGLLRSLSPVRRWAEQARPGNPAMARAEAALGLGYSVPGFQSEEAFRALMPLLTDPDGHVRASAALALVGHRDRGDEVVARLVGLAADGDARVRRAALFALEQVVEPGTSAVRSVRPALLAALDDPRPSIRLEASRALYVVGLGTEAIAALTRLVLEERGSDRLGALGFLGRLGVVPAEVEPALRAMLASPTAAERLHAAEALGRLGQTEAAGAALRAMLASGSLQERLDASGVLIRLGDAEAARPTLREIARVGPPSHRSRAEALLDRAARRDPGP